MTYVYPAIQKRLTYRQIDTEDVNLKVDCRAKINLTIVSNVILTIAQRVWLIFTPTISRSSGTKAGCKKFDILALLGRKFLL